MMCPFLGLWAHATARDAGKPLEGTMERKRPARFPNRRAKVPFPIVATGRPGLVVPGRPPFFKQTNENAMFLQEIAFKLISMAESADALCRQNPRHRCAMHLRDFCTQVSEGVRALSPATLEAIKNG